MRLGRLSAIVLLLALLTAASAFAQPDAGLYLSTPELRVGANVTRDGGIEFLTTDGATQSTYVSVGGNVQADPEHGRTPA